MAMAHLEVPRPHHHLVERHDGELGRERPAAAPDADARQRYALGTVCAIERPAALHLADAAAGHGVLLRRYYPAPTATGAGPVRAPAHRPPPPRADHGSQAPPPPPPPPAGSPTAA